MAEFVAESHIPASRDTVFGWHARPGAFERLSPPGSRFRVIEHTGGIENGARNVFDIRVGPLWRRWVAEHDGYVPGRRFRDTQVSGPLRHWVHTHEFTADRGGCRLRDSIVYRLPAAPLTDPLAPAVSEHFLRPMFGFRHARTRLDISRHLAYEGERLRIAVTGSTGFVGSALVPYLTTAGHEVTRVRPGGDTSGGDITWDPERGHLRPDALEGFDAVVHLGGEPIAGRWTQRKRDAIYASRVRSTDLLARHIARLQDPPKLLIVASAIGYYGDAGSTPLDEDVGAGAGFLADVVSARESAAEPAERAGVRVVNLRSGVVLGAGGGLLARLAPLVRAGAGAVVGDGRRWMSWIALDDLLGVVERALWDPALAGPVNAVAPSPVRHAEFMHALGRTLHRPVLLRVPGGIVRAAAGEAASLVLDSQRVVPARLGAADFGYVAGDLDVALAWELAGIDPGAGVRGTATIKATA